MPTFNKWSSLSKYKKRQYALAGALLTSIMAVTFGSMYILELKQKSDASGQSKDAIAKVKPSEIASPINSVDGPAYLNSGVGVQVDVQKKEIDDLKKQLDAIQKGQAKGSLSTPPNLSSLPPLPPEGMKSANVGKNGLGKPNLNDAGDENEIIQSIVFAKGINSANASGKQGNPITSNNPFAKNSNSIPNRQDVVTKSGIRPNILVTEDGGHVYGMDGRSNASLNSTGKFRALQSYIPTGSFFRAVLLGGLDAPTGGESANSNPHPVLMQITDMAQLPNSFRVNFKKCFVTGTGYGDLSSERAMIRTEQLSCVGVDGRAIDIPIKGYVAGDDGKTGVRGRLVSKQGAVIKNALIAGVLSGIGQGLSSAASVTTNNGLGSVSTISDGKRVQNALGSGAGNAFDRLAEYYVKLADKMFPVVEIDAGRSVEIVLMKGFQIEGE